MIDARLSEPVATAVGRVDLVHDPDGWKGARMRKRRETHKHETRELEEEAKSVSKRGKGDEEREPAHCRRRPDQTRTWYLLAEALR